jgi:hypothetical protein
VLGVEAEAEQVGGYHVDDVEPGVAEAVGRGVGARGRRALASTAITVCVIRSKDEGACPN